MPLLSRLALVALALFLVVPPEATAQSLRDRMRRAADAAKRTAEQTERSTATVRDASSTSMAQDAEAAAAHLADYPPLDYSSVPFPPAIVMESVLTNLRMLPLSGDLRLESFWVAFPPTTDVEGNEVDYSEQMRMHVRLKESGGTLLMDRYYVPRGGFDNRVFTQFGIAGGSINRRSVSRTDETDRPLVVTEPGTYHLEFLFDDRVFWMMPLEVVQLADSDPYAQSGPRYLLRGPWQEYGFLGFGELHTRAQPSTKLYWHAYTQLEATDRARVTQPLTLELYRDGHLLAKAHVDQMDVKSERRLEAWPLRSPGASEDITQADLTDGAYEIRYGLGDGPTKVYPFEVRDGAIVPQGRQVREDTDPLRFIEGLNQAWWLQPQ